MFLSLEKRKALKSLIKAIPTVIVLILSLISCKSTPVLQEHTIKEMKEIKSAISEIYEMLPTTVEKEFGPENRINNLGENAYTESLALHTIELHTINEEYMKWISDGNNVETDHDDDELGHWLTDAIWGWLDTTTNLKDLLLDESDREKAVKEMHAMNHIVVLRIDEMSEGEVLGDQILEDGFFKGWMWLVDWKRREVVGCKRLELTTSSAFESSRGMKHMRINLENKINEACNKVLNEWGPDRGNTYLY